MITMTTKDLSVAANAKSANIYEGKMGRFVPPGSTVRVYAAGSATGLQLQLALGGLTVIDDQPISDVNRFPVRPDDLIGAFQTRRGGELFGFLRNTTVGALTVEVITDVE